jgi:hypothetical protein
LSIYGSLVNWNACVVVDFQIFIDVHAYEKAFFGILYLTKSDVPLNRSRRLVGEAACFAQRSKPSRAFFVEPTGYIRHPQPKSGLPIAQVGWRPMPATCGPARTRLGRLLASIDFIGSSPAFAGRQRWRPLQDWRLGADRAASGSHRRPASVPLRMSKPGSHDEVGSSGRKRPVGIGARPPDGSVRYRRAGLDARGGSRP